MSRAYSTYGEERGAQRVFVGKPEGSDHVEDPRVYGRTMLKWMFEKWDKEQRLDQSGLGEWQ
jgi:hypothetical protein